MDLIIDFYKSLDTLNLIIFWGIIIVIILLLIFSFVLMNKNRKLKSMVESKNKIEEELAIKVEEVPNKEDTMKIMPISEESIVEPETISKQIETEKEFVAEEHVIEYNKEPSSPEIHTHKPIEMPTGPYQRNVLREMSLSQTSPIGINRQDRKDEKKVEMARDLEESLNNKQINQITTEEKIVQKQAQIVIEDIDEQIKEDLIKINSESPRKTDINIDSSVGKVKEHSMEKEIINTHTHEILNSQPSLKKTNQIKNDSEKYLEEVSRKLAEAEIPDDIERTNYELKQEADAIISYKELMEKKDTIQTIDEEEAVISIEELMNRNNQKIEPESQDTKLYNLGEEEENDNFIKELKQFRNDL